MGRKLVSMGFTQCQRQTPLTSQREQSMDFVGQPAMSHGLFENDIGACCTEVMLHGRSCPRYHHDTRVGISQLGMGTDRAHRFDAAAAGLIIDDDHLHGRNLQKGLKSCTMFETWHFIAARLRQETPVNRRKCRVRCQYCDCSFVHKQAERC